MRKFVLVSMIALSAAANAAQASGNFADPYCDNGCRLIDHIESAGDPIYYGEVAKSYRVCHADGYSLAVTVDGNSYDVPKGNLKVRNCTDVTGKAIVISGSGAALVGPIGP